MNVSIHHVATTLPDLDEVPESLTYTEAEERTKLETQIGKTFYEKGKALEQINDRKLYRDKWKTFEDYCKDRFGFGGNYAYKHIAAAGLYDHLRTSLGGDAGSPPVSSCTNCISPLPTNEAQCRELTGLLVEHRTPAWELAVAMANGRVPAAAKVKRAVKQILEELRQDAPNPFKAGDVALVIASDVKGKKNRWCIISETKGAYCHCTDYLGEFKAHAEDLKYLDFDPDQKVFMQGLCVRLACLWQRLSAIPQSDHALPILVYLAKLQRAYLTEAEEQLLITLESHI